MGFEPFASPRSTVPNEPERVAGIRPSIQDKGTIAGALIADVTGQVVAQAQKSLEIQHELDLNEVQSQVLQDLETARSTAMELTDPDEVDATYDELAAKARLRLDELTPNDRQALATGATNRETIHRANHINPRIVSLKRDRLIAKDEVFTTTLENSVADAADPALTIASITDAAEHYTSLANSGAISAANATAKTMTVSNGLFKITLNSMIRLGRFDEAYEFSKNPDVTVSRDVRDFEIKKAFQARSLNTWARINNEMNHPMSKWRSQAGQDQLDSMFKFGDEKVLTPKHYQQLSNKISSLRQRAISPQEQSISNTLSAIAGQRQAIAAMAAASPDQGITVPSRGSFVGPDTPFRGLVLDDVIKLDYDDHIAVQAAAGATPLPPKEFLLSWVQTEGKIPPTSWRKLLAGVSLEDNPEEAVLNDTIDSLMTMMVIESAAVFDVPTIKMTTAGTQVMKAYNLFKTFFYGKQIDRLEGVRFDFKSGSGIISANGGALRNILTKEQAWKATRDAMARGKTTNASIVDRNTKRTEFQLGVQDELGPAFAVEAYSNLQGHSMSEEEIGEFRINAMTQIAKEIFVEGGFSVAQSYVVAAQELVITRGQRVSDFNFHSTDEIEQWPMDHPIWDQMDIEIDLPSGAPPLRIGKEAYKADVILDIGRHVYLALQSNRDEKSFEKAESLRIAIETLKADTRFTTGHDVGDPLGVGNFNIDFDNLPLAGTAQNLKGYVTLERLASTWADLAGMSLVDAYHEINLIAFGEALPPGNFWEPGMVGDTFTRFGATPKSDLALPSWQIIAQFGLDADERPIIWQGAKPHGWRREFKQEFGPFDTMQGQKVFPTNHPFKGGDSNVLLATTGGKNPDDPTGLTDEPVHVFPTMVEGKKLSGDAALAIAVENGLDNYPVFETIEDAQQWIDLNHGNIDPQGRLVQDPQTTSTFRRNLSNPVLLRYFGIDRRQTPEQLQEAIDFEIKLSRDTQEIVERLNLEQLDFIYPFAAPAARSFFRAGTSAFLRAQRE